MPAAANRRPTRVAPRRMNREHEAYDHDTSLRGRSDARNALSKGDRLARFERDGMGRLGTSTAKP